MAVELPVKANSKCVLQCLPRLYMRALCWTESSAIPQHVQHAAHLQEHLLLAQLLGDVVGGGAGHLNPRFRE